MLQLRLGTDTLDQLAILRPGYRAETITVAPHPLAYGEWIPFLAAHWRQFSTQVDWLYSPYAYFLLGALLLWIGVVSPCEHPVSAYLAGPASPLWSELCR